MYWDSLGGFSLSWMKAKCCFANSIACRIVASIVSSSMLSSSSDDSADTSGACDELARGDGGDRVRKREAKCEISEADIGTGEGFGADACVAASL